MCVYCWFRCSPPSFPSVCLRERGANLSHSLHCFYTICSVCVWSQWRCPQHLLHPKMCLATHTLQPFTCRYWCTAALHKIESSDSRLITHTHTVQSTLIAVDLKLGTLHSYRNVITFSSCDYTWCGKRCEDVFLHVIAPCYWTQNWTQCEIISCESYYLTWSLVKNKAICPECEKWIHWKQWKQMWRTNTQQSSTNKNHVWINCENKRIV